MKKTLINSLLILILGTGGLLFNKFTSSPSPKPLVEELSKTLPTNPNSKLIKNKDLGNPGMEYISSVYITQDDKNADTMVSDFIFKAYEQGLEGEMKNISAVSIVIFKNDKDKSKTKQYRILLGRNVAGKQDSAFWKRKNKSSLFSWLKETCPKTNSNNLKDFCDISDNLN